MFVEDYKLGTLRFYYSYGRRVLRFVPVSGYKKSFLMMGPSHSIREKDLPSEFSLYIQYNMSEMDEEQGLKSKSLIPDWKCKKEKQRIHLDLPNFEALNLR